MTDNGAQVDECQGLANDEGRPVHSGVWRHSVYCGVRFADHGKCPCGRCDGICGPNTGCPCDSCLRLACLRRSLGNDRGVLVHEGTGAGAGVLYCSKRWCTDRRCRCGCCDGVCGPNDGCACPACSGLLVRLVSLAGVRCPRGHETLPVVRTVGGVQKIECSVCGPTLATSGSLLLGCVGSSGEQQRWTLCSACVMKQVRRRFKNFSSANRPTFASPSDPVVVPPELVPSHPEGAAGADTPTLHDALRSLQQELTCVVCMSNKRTILFTPCNHLICCTSCSQSLALCPLCRSPIGSQVKTFW